VKKKEHNKHRGHHKHDDKDKSSKKQHGKGQQTEMDTTLESASLLAIPSTSTHPIWSTFGIILVSLTCVVGFIVSLYIFNRLKKRHCDYEEVSELDADRLLYV